MKMLLKHCSCKDWVPNINYISGAMQRTIHHASIYKTTAQFEYCPWCGKKLEDPDEDVQVS